MRLVFLCQSVLCWLSIRFPVLLQGAVKIWEPQLYRRTLIFIRTYNKLTVMHSNDIPGEGKPDPVAFIIVGIGSPEKRIINLIHFFSRKADAGILCTTIDIRISSAH